jgi:hypothetical protein
MKTRTGEKYPSLIAQNYPVGYSVVWIHSRFADRSLELEEDAGGIVRRLVYGFLSILQPPQFGVNRLSYRRHLPDLFTSPVFSNVIIRLHNVFYVIEGPRKCGIFLEAIFLSFRALLKALSQPTVNLGASTSKKPTGLKVPLKG